MQYRKDIKHGNNLSALGFGCMRFTKRFGTIDQEKAEKEMTAAINGGVNYFDTAYVYPGSEACLGKFLVKGYRDMVNIATKLPHYLIKNTAEADKIFDEELKRLRTDRIDYYLIHMLTDINSWNRIVDMGIKEWIARRKASGQIIRIGFSYHGGAKGFIDILNAYDWDFCQIQFNYMDENSQAGLSGLKAAYEKGIPVIIMEPLRGGRLTNGLPADAKKVFRKQPQKMSPAEWGLRWIWNHPEATVILSGMNSIEQVEENMRVADTALPDSLTAKDLLVYEEVKNIINKNIKVPCTGCSYCMPCPQGVDIPTCFRCYNVKASDGWFNGIREYLMCTTFRKEKTNASLCKKCGKCEKHCPQAIKIRDELQNVQTDMERLPYKIARTISKLVKF